SLNWRFVSGLSKKYMLLLTATPVQNDMEELFNLISLLKPGALHTYDGFLERYVAGAARRVLARVPDLLGGLRGVMIRYPGGLVRGPTCGAEECERLAALRDDARAIATNIKADRLRAFLRTFDEKALVFTQYVRTLRYLEGVLRSDGYRIATYHGGLGAAAKDAAVRAFREDAQVFLSTEAGGEGRNLQFARTVVNYDLPWNPLRIEQRIGRVHRLGQDREVHVVNLWAEDTIEAY